MTEKKRYYRTNMNLVDEQYNPYYSIRDRETDKCLFTVTGKYTSKGIVDLLNEYDSELQMCREKVVYWRNKANDTFGDMRTNVELEKRINELEKENETLKDTIDGLTGTMAHMEDLCDSDVR